MAYGFRFINAAGLTAIDEQFQCLHVKTEGASTGTLYSAGTKTNSIGTEFTNYFSGRSIPNITEVGYLLIPPGSTWVATTMLSDVVNGNGFGIYGFFTLSSSTTIPHVFAALSGGAKEPGNWGMRVFNSAGTEVFDSRYKYLQAVDTVLVSVPSTANQSIFATHVSCPGAWYLVGSVGGLRIVNHGSFVGAPLDFYGVGLRQSSNTQLELKMILTSRWTDPGGWFSQSSLSRVPASCRIMVCKPPV